MTVLALLACAAVVVVGRRTRRVGTARQPRGDSLQLALLIRIGLSSGLSLAGALDMASPHVNAATAELIRTVLRSGLPSGLTAALARQGDEETRLFRVLADAHLSGSPALFAVNSFIGEELERRRVAALHRARVLPVRLTLPVALGLLPGFVLLGVAPQVVLAIRDLLGQVAGL